MTIDRLGFQIQLKVVYPQRMYINQSYLITADIVNTSLQEDIWHTIGEEYPFTCIINGNELFDVDTIERQIVVHRFGGSYGPAQFLVSPQSSEHDASLEIALINQHGIPVKVQELNGIEILNITDLDRPINPAIPYLVDAFLTNYPNYDNKKVTTAFESILMGNPALINGHAVSLFFPESPNSSHALISVGDVYADHTITVQLPQPIDPLPAALAAIASIPLNDVPAPRLDLPHASRLPFEASPHFVGREAELKALAQAIGTARPAVVMPAVATGLGGIGKTSLVTEFAYRYGVYFHGGVFWLNCTDPDQVATQIASCAVGLNIDIAGMALNEQAQRVMIAWQSPMPRLLIFDNCENQDILDQWKPTIGGCRVLVTSRSDHWTRVTQIRLGLLSLVDSRTLLQNLCARLNDMEADAIVTDLGHLPLALHLAGSYLNTYPHHTVDQYRKDLTIAHRSLKGHGALPSPTRHELDVEATFSLSFNQLDPTNAIDALALEMLDGAAWCAHGVPLSRYLVLAFVPDGTDNDDAVDALRLLQRLGLLDGTDTVILHPLMAQVVHARLGSPEALLMVEDRLGTAASRAHATGVPSNMLSLEPHLRQATMRALERGGVRAARLSNNLGGFEEQRGAYREAQALFERALIISEAVLGVDHPETAMIINNLALVLERQGQYGAAQGLFERALAINEAVLGADNPATAQSVNNLALVLERQGQYTKAKELFERALAVREAVLGVDHPETAQSVDNLAVVLERQGQYGAAQELFERALAINETVLGTDHPATAAILNNLALVLERQGRYGEAQALFERTLAVREAMLGADHPDTATSVNNLASVLAQQGQYGEAQALFERALAINEAVLGVDHPAAAAILNNLAFILERQERYVEAQALFERALAVRERMLGVDHPDTAISINNLAMVLDEQGRYGEAQALFEQALVVRKAMLGVDHPDTMATMNNLARVLETQRQYAKAQSLYEQAFSISKRILGFTHPDTQSLQQDVGRVQRLHQDTKKKRQK
ncbi:tetratricopeptide repeat protein [Herpetosiphon giganteus]|uniref:tetratricopeptide repeat protein n=1 Tax=Herpetosiphon giganteus TaxID=2029754 RepID=UPI001EF93741|nr:tetratricopeptide repeat protein [Herpetosiphon giganteus]MBM7845925.1 tetratricopeptide (TPR) repeat protein [Herpetosiphon giganteus]